MYKKFSKGLVLGLMVCGLLGAGSSYAQEGSAYPMRSVTILPNFGGLGLGTRHWETAQYGWGLEFQPSWEFNDFVYSATALYSPFAPKKSKQYFGLGIGGFSYNESFSYGTTSMDLKYGGMVVKVFSGWEWLKGIKKNQGISAEVGLQFGSATMKGTLNDPYWGSYAYNSEFTMPVIYVGGTYAFYYNKK